MSNTEKEIKTLLDVILAGGYVPCHECGVRQPDYQPNRAVNDLAMYGPICQDHLDKLGEY